MPELQSKGYYSQIEIKTIDNVKYIDKKLYLAIGRDEAEIVRQKILLQREAFTELRIPTSKLVNIEVFPEQATGKFVITVREVFAGLDFMDVVDNDNFPMYLDKLLKDVYRPLLLSTSEDYLRAGIDPVLRNFVYDNRAAEFCYVDFLPPKVFYKGTYSQEIPELTDPDFFEIRKFAHNFRPGIVYVTYINLVREFPQHARYIAGRIAQFLAEIKQPQLYQYIQDSPLYRVHDKTAAERVIDGIGDWRLSNYFMLRELANWILTADPSFSEQHKQIFKLTHHVTNPADPEYGRLSASNFQQVLAGLRSGVRELS